MIFVFGIWTSNSKKSRRQQCNFLKLKDMDRAQIDHLNLSRAATRTHPSPPAPISPKRKSLGRKVSIMAASSRGLLCLKWTLRIFSSNNVPFNRIKTSALKINTCGIIFSTQRRFYCADAKSDEEETSTDSPPRTLLEAYQTEPVLLHGPRKPVKPLSEEYVQQELEKSRKIRFRTPLPINPREAQWTPESKRAGLIGVKIGMTALWLKDGTRKPVTLVEVIMVITWVKDENP